MEKTLEPYIGTTPAANLPFDTSLIGSQLNEAQCCHPRNKTGLTFDAIT